MKYASDVQQSVCYQRLNRFIEIRNYPTIGNMSTFQQQFILSFSK
jgi:hypothetical protein